MCNALKKYYSCGSAGWIWRVSLSEVMDILAEGFHILAGVFERLALHFGRDFVLIAGAGTTSEFDGE